MTQARIRIDPELSGLSRSDWERLIHESNLGDEDADIATKYFINHQCQIDIAIDKDADRKTIYRRLLSIKKRIKDMNSYGSL